MRFVLAAAIALLPLAVLATPATAEEGCEISVHDHTPDQYPGGLHIHNTCA